MKFYVIDKPKVDSHEERLGRVDVIKGKGFRTGEALRCSECARFLGSLPWLPPYRVVLETWGEAFGDVAELGNEMIVSERLMHLFQQDGLKGLSNFEPIEILKVIYRRKRPRQPIPRYFKTAVSLSSTAVDQLASGYVWRHKTKVCPTCLWDDLKRFDRIVINEVTWNGDDIFYARGGSRLMASERFKLFYDENRMLGIVFKDPEMESYDYYPWEEGGAQEIG